MAHVVLWLLLVGFNVRRPSTFLLRLMTDWVGTRDTCSNPQNQDKEALSSRRQLRHRLREIALLLLLRDYAE